MSTERIDLVGTFLTRQQAAQRLQVSVRTVDRYIAEGKLPASRLPGDRLVRIPGAAVDSLLVGIPA